MTVQTAAPDDTRNGFSLEDRYRRSDGTIYLSGIHALVRMLLDRVRHDRAGGVDTGVYVSGYEGSPLAGYDLELGRRRDLLAEHAIVHRPGLNEELAATSVAGTQIAGEVGRLKHDGVLGVWYGKAPGLDRATDALRHANLMGTAPRGGALALVGDDPGAKSSTVPSASEFALADLDIPTFYPADPAEVLAFAPHAIELSRAAGVWTAIKLATAVADGSATAAATSTWQPPELRDLPSAYAHRPHAHLLGAKLAELEQSLQSVRLPVAAEYVRRSGLNVITGSRDPRIGLVAAGKTYLDLKQALRALGLTDDELDRRGVRLLKLGVLYPLEPSVVEKFAAGLDEIVVVEDKRPFVENAIKASLYGHAVAPAVSGKCAPDGIALFRRSGELEPEAITRGLADRLRAHGDFPSVQAWSERRPRERTTLALAPRSPYFCSGCPHNSSAKVPDGTVVGGGIGCHAMVLFMPTEQVGTVAGLSQMGGEGAHWIGMSPFLDKTHFVQNMGDGTFAHSGSLAVRAAVAAGVDMTFKILFNSAVAMTGGQDAVGGPDLAHLVAMLDAERVSRIVVTSDRPKQARRVVGSLATVRHRDELLDVQQELAGCAGVTVLIHEQECAAEKRRKRRRGTMATPTKRIMINERVCEGCGDCGSQSNCLSVRPVATEFGRKTQIHQSSCNFDYSCVQGDCPSFLSVTPSAQPKRPGSTGAPIGTLPDPDPLFGAADFSMRIAGVGGTGVTTTAQILATAAVIEGRYVRALDQTGLAQKGGAVVSDLKITSEPMPAASKLGPAECDLFLGSDSLVATDPLHAQVCDPTRTVGVICTSEVPTGHMVVDTTIPFPDVTRVRAAVDAMTRQAAYLDAGAIAEARFGDEQYANLVLVGAAYQAGALPISIGALERAIELNGVEVERNIQALAAGRGVVAGAPEPSSPADPDTTAETAESAAGRRLIGDLADDAGPDLVQLVSRRASDLIAYQNESYAREYVAFVERVHEREQAVLPGRSDVTEAVAQYLYKLMAYKDEYEVARLSIDPALRSQVEEQFGPGSSYSFTLHPPVLRALGLNRKISLGRWFVPCFRVLHAMRWLRGGVLDVFGYAHVRRVERQLIRGYRSMIDRALDLLTPDRHGLVVDLARLPDLVRGYEQLKLDNVAKYQQRTAELLTELDSAPSVT